ncbi:hypothetical protein ACT4ML_13085 [Natrinema sp. LN54]|uniref:hypothetical protein n=1 Tax=Natrinema sp. LN54 TaxID=3458705 RepID=UPI004035FA7F
MEITLLFLGIYALIMGIVGAIWPYETTRVGETIASTKNRRPSQEVDPDGRRVSYIQAWGVIIAIFGAVILALGFIFL